MSREIVFGKQVKALRTKRGLSQSDFAGILGVKQNSISHYETNRSFPEMYMLLSIAEYFNVSLDYLVYGQLEDDVIDLALSTPKFKYKGTLLSEESKARVIDQAYLESLRQKDNQNKK